MAQPSPAGRSGEGSGGYDDDATRVGLTWDPDATHVGIPVDPDATRVGLPVDPEATRVGLPPVPDPGRESVRSTMPERHTIPESDPDETFVSIREPVLPWAAPNFSAQGVDAGASAARKPTPPVVPGWRRWWWVPVLAVVLVVAVVVVLAVTNNHKTKTDTVAAQDTVEGYLDALVDGDAATALKIWRPDTVSGEDLILDPEIYSASKNRPTRYEIQSVTADDDEVTVKADLTQSSETFPVSFDLRRKDQSGASWKVTDGPEQELVVDQPVSSVTVNGQNVSLPSDQDKVRLAALPGDYDVVAASSREGVNYVDSTVTVLPTSGDDGRSSLSFPSSQVRAAIDAGGAPGAGGPRPANAQQLNESEGGLAMLMSPAGNIGCEFTETSKGCGLLSYRDDPESTDSNSGQWWFDLEGGDDSSLQEHNSLARFQAEDAKPHQMDYGETVYYRDNVCAMLDTGMTCWDTRTGHGVFMSRKAYNTF
ncbi:hypothetical protein [Galactobacter sp.]|uniref:hypothetical protein n=1 Tax=Galactobacter sp. TaxID=2676125 RepID=UPI0025B81672|nr:hypothetical protein [Galactobacter sp.]